MQTILGVLGAVYLLIEVILVIVLFNKRNGISRSFHILKRLRTRRPLPSGTRAYERPIPSRSHRSTATPIPYPTATPIPYPTATPIPFPTKTPIPYPTKTPIPYPTATPTSVLIAPATMGCGVVNGNLACVSDPEKRLYRCGRQQDCADYQQSKQSEADIAMVETQGETCFGYGLSPPVGAAQWTSDEKDASRTCHFDKVVGTTFRDKVCPKGTQPKFFQSQKEKREKSCGFHDKYVTSVQYLCCDETDPNNCLSPIHPVMTPVWVYDNNYAPEIGEIVLGRGNTRNDCADGQHRGPCANDVGKCQAWLNNVLNQVNNKTFMGS